MKPFSKEKKLRKIEEVEKYFLPLYEKLESVFTNFGEYKELYPIFIQLLKVIIKKSKLNI
jgi:hypothetical protein